MNEAETRAEPIEPAPKEVGWGVVEASPLRSRVFTLGGRFRAVTSEPNFLIGF
ncbi:hypothetical protein [Wenzhouxiangella limi]|uniref:Uncharacterized protein n=1 Tax=Wenzhouxiangella limi TaxID=2707351 RepID=A0A845V5N5_9GAMM|nr:hypothetical protein [Wenzhouxiangella limi]NDY95511.1 hypothetical protein [Wenzhouxiangella limi]